MYNYVTAILHLLHCLMFYSLAHTEPRHRPILFYSPNKTKTRASDYQKFAWNAVPHNHHLIDHNLMHIKTVRGIVMQMMPPNESNLNTAWVRARVCVCMCAFTADELLLSLFVFAQPSVKLCIIFISRASNMWRIVEHNWI